MHAATVYAASLISQPHEVYTSKCTDLISEHKSENQAEVVYTQLHCIIMELSEKPCKINHVVKIFLTLP